MKCKIFSWVALLLIVPTLAYALAAAGRYVVDAKGETVADTFTQLTWQRSVTTVLTFADATTYCSGLTLAGSVWRVPNVRELRSLVDRLGSVAIDPTAFPSAPAEVFWSSSAVAGQNAMWAVNFLAGSGTAPRVATLTARVRCVH